MTGEERRAQARFHEAMDQLYRRWAIQPPTEEEVRADLDWILAQFGKVAPERWLMPDHEQKQKPQ